MSGLLPTDEQLLRDVGAGDGEAFSVFYGRHRDAVIAFFARRTDDRELVFDLTSETFAAVVAGASSYRDEGPALGWLFGVARNKLRDSLRRGQIADDARRRLGLERIVLTDDDLDAVELAASTGNAQLDDALEALPEDVRQVLLARVVEERGYGDIAEQLGCSEQVVRQRVHRGLRRLRARLEPQR